MTAAQAIARIEQELNYIGRTVSNMQSDDYESERAVHVSLDFIRTTLLELQPDATEEIPEGVRYPAAA